MLAHRGTMHADRHASNVGLQQIWHVGVICSERDEVNDCRSTVLFLKLMSGARNNLQFAITCPSGK